MKNVKKILLCLSPLLLFPALLIPYSFLNQNFIVKWFGCGCPKVDQWGNTVDSYFNANDFTLLFWLFVSLCVVLISVKLSKWMKGKGRILFLLSVLAFSLFITSHFYSLMMWN